MPRVIRYGIGLLSTLLTCVGYAQVEQVSHKQMVLKALTQFEQTPRDEWAFKVTRYENEEGDITSSIERFEPVLEPSQRWQLIAKDGQPATQKQRERFAKAKNKQGKKQGAENGLSLSLRKLIREDSLELNSDSEQHFTMGFKVVMARLGEEAEQQLTGLLTYNKVEHFIEKVEISNLDPFSPMFMVSISSFNLSLHFLKIDDAILPSENRLHMKGKMSFVTQIDEQSVDTFSEYRRQGINQ